jgi:hypothetical protein
MTELMLDSGEIITDPKLILAEVHRFYCSLYKPNPVDTEQKQSTIAELLQYTVNTITSSQLLSIERTPDEEELTKIVKSFAHNKAPGSDGLTIEVVKECWPFLKVDILELVQHFWATGTLYPELLSGIFRIIPKQLDKLRLKFWRPLTMLQIVYKIIAKLLANRLGIILPTIVSPKQTGFVPGRQILHNISMAYLLSDWSAATASPTLFILLDFEKAFDRVDFDIFWPQY